MRGRAIDAHYVVEFTVREGETMKKLCMDLTSEGEYPLNEHEEEILEAIINTLSQEIGQEKPLSWD